MTLTEKISKSIKRVAPHTKACPNCGFPNPRGPERYFIGAQHYVIAPVFYYECHCGITAVCIPTADKGRINLEWRYMLSIWSDQTLFDQVASDELKSLAGRCKYSYQGLLMIALELGVVSHPERLSLLEKLYNDNPDGSLAMAAINMKELLNKLEDA